MEFTWARVWSADGVEGLWRGIEARSACSFFLSWTWIGAWLRESVTGVPWLLVGHSEGRPVLAGLFLGHWRARLGVRVLSLHETGDARRDRLTIEYNGFLVAGDAPAEARALAYGFLTRCWGGPAWQALCLGGIDGGERAAALASGLVVQRQRWQPCFGVDLAGLRADGRGLADGLTGSTGRGIRRSLRLYESRGRLGIRSIRGLERGEAFGRLVALHQATWRGRDQPGAFGDPAIVAFHRRLIAADPAGVSIEIAEASAGGEVFGYLYNFRHGARLYNYQGGFLYETDNRLKPGLVAHCLCADAAAAAGFEVYDLMAGDSRYKRALALESGPLHWVHLARPWHPGLLAERVALRLRRWARSR